jgi:Tautomerase enzyme
LNVPERNRYQVVTEHKPSHLIAENTGLGINRTDKFVLIQVIARSRAVCERRTQKRIGKGFHRLLICGFGAASA